MVEQDGRKRLERMGHLLGTDHFNEPSAPSVKQTPVGTPVPPSLQLVSGSLATSGQETAVRVPVLDPKAEVKPADSEPRAETDPTETPATPTSRGGKRSLKTPPSEELPASSRELAPSPPSTSVSGARLRATKIVDDQFHIEHVYENPEVTPPKKGKRQSTPPPPSTEVATPETAMPAVGQDMESVVTDVSPSVPAPVDVKPEEIPPSVPVSAPVSSPTPPVAAPHLNHSGGENHPKVPWSVKVPLDMYDFIRDHDNYRPFLKDQRPFREKFLEWVSKMRADASPELIAAQEAAAKVRSGPAESSPPPKSGTPTLNKEPTL
ncbi:MAG: hypothetical protein JRN35_07015 [Nitrososphaerota archaeon]|nr:hypothetical protein [Nitrososphaerota archaeon]